MMSASSSQIQSSHGDVLSTSVGENQQSHAVTGNNIHTQAAPNRSSKAPARKINLTKSHQPCRFFTSKNGCRAGDQCRYQHVRPTEIASSAQPSNSSEATNHPEPHDANATSSPPDGARQPLTVSRPSAKPVSQKELENPREYQITQLVRRFSPFRADLDDKTSLKFRLVPTDPDFPFELETGLHCFLSVPLGYPHDARPSLQVQNPEMPKGFQINVERGFDSLVQQHPGKSLLALFNELDKNLEGFLSSAKATTVKFVAPLREKVTVQESKTPDTPEPLLQKHFQSVAPRYSSDQLKEAKIRRDAEIRQLEARLGRSENFSKAGDGVAFNVPLQVPSSASVPPSLRSLRESALIVPDVYPLEPCTIILRGVDGQEAENVEISFEKRVVSNSQLTLMAHINYLTQNLGKLAIDTKPQQEMVNVTDDEVEESTTVTASNERARDEGVQDPNRPHLKYIARPPEWAVHHDQDSSDETDSSDYESDEDNKEEENGDNIDSEVASTVGGVSLPQSSNSGVEKGTSISFPGLNMNGIELLELTNLSIVIKCERCKLQADIKDIKPSKPENVTHRAETCTKCTAPFKITYRPDFIHTNNPRAGYVDLENSTVVSLLPCTFQPTCANCSTPFPTPPGVNTIPGDTSQTVCRTCHSKMTLLLPTVKFLRISPVTTNITSLALRASKPKESLPTSINTPLPLTGNCEHYRHSHRWFRFTCCATVYPCDKCHDLSPTQRIDPHPNEHADRMICGWCSREQRYHPDTCRFCGQSVVKGGGRVSGFWEGGKGTRERHLMRRKEGRKFKRSGTEKKGEEERRRKRKEGKGNGGMWWPG